MNFDVSQVEGQRFRADQPALAVHDFASSHHGDPDLTSTIAAMIRGFKSRAVKSISLSRTLVSLPGAGARNSLARIAVPGCSHHNTAFLHFSPTCSFGVASYVPQRLKAPFACQPSSPHANGVARTQAGHGGLHQRGDVRSFLEPSSTGQYIELRGEPSATIDDGTYCWWYLMTIEALRTQGR